MFDDLIMTFIQCKVPKDMRDTCDKVCGLVVFKKSNEQYNNYFKQLFVDKDQIINEFKSK
jgi:hypothetical protein